MKKWWFSKKSDVLVEGESMKPRGIHHTVNYATSYEETWAHIRQEVQNIYTMSANLMPEDRSIL
ncbi:MAG: hypothetical protein ACFB15_32415 [Cyclobacteriaceae bacterium]